MGRKVGLSFCFIQFEIEIAQTFFNLSIFMNKLNEIFNNYTFLNVASLSHGLEASGQSIKNCVMDWCYFSFIIYTEIMEKVKVWSWFKKMFLHLKATVQMKQTILKLPK